MKKILPILILMFFFDGVTTAQGVLSQFSDDDGNFIKLGAPSNLLTPRDNLFIGADFIQTNLLNNTPFVIPEPTLRLNPQSGNVTIGNTNADFAALTIRSFDEANNDVDLRLEGNGRIGTQGSLFIQLDDNNTSSDYFSIKDSNWGDLFYVGENGDNKLNGGITINGDLTLNGDLKGIEDVHYIDGSIFVTDDRTILLGGRINRFWSIENTTTCGPLRIPDGSVINKIDIFYFDDSPFDIDITIYGYNQFYKVVPVEFELFQWDSSGDDPDGRKHTADNLNLQINYQDNTYIVCARSDDWDAWTVEFRGMKFYYTR